MTYGPALDKLFHLLLQQYGTVYLVGHDIDTALALLKRCWVPPSQTIIFDTQELWQHRNKEIRKVSLPMALETTRAVRFETCLLSKPGNSAYLILNLLDALAEGHRYLEEMVAGSRLET